MASPILPDDLWKRLEPWIPKPKEYRHVQFDILSIVLNREKEPEYFLIEDVFL